MHSSLLTYIQMLNSTPTAPFREQWICRVLDDLLSSIPGLEMAADRFGNRIVRLRRGEPPGPPATFVAHLDHPGFLVAPDAIRNGSYTYTAFFEGRVASSYFPKSRVRLFRTPDDSGVPAVVEACTEEDPNRNNRQVSLRSDEAADGAVLAMWDIPPFVLRDGHVEARVCDDLVGCAVILEALRRLAAEPHVDVCAIFSRAEEAGFCGVLCLLAEPSLHPLLDPQGVFISVETSSERPGISVGDGAVIRLGDRMSTFEAAVVDKMWAVAKARMIPARRVLMDGGTCEATAFARAGLRTGGVCIPLRNYHNMDKERGGIAPEIVSTSDASALADLITEFVLHQYDKTESDIYSSQDFDLFLNKGRTHLI